MMVVFCLLGIATISSFAFKVQSAELPVVDLGYVVQQATLNNSGPAPLLTFSNIRYAAPPVGNLRFAPPIVPQTVNRTVNDGQQAVTCPQAAPTWALTGLEVVNGATSATIATSTATVTSSASATSSTAASLQIPPPSSTTSEDCLFLDVVVPENIYNSKYAEAQRASQTNQTVDSEGSKGAPVLVWIYGGGYVLGDKTDINNPATLIANSVRCNQEGVIFISPNYRLGLFGWQASSSFQSEGGTANVGLLDQRLAFEWVHKYIHLFGGDPSRVTIIGESAGGGSIMHHIAAPSSYNNSGLFSQAIAQSPAFQPVTNTQQTETFKNTLLLASSLIGQSITTLAQLKALPFTVIYDVNVALVAASEYGTFTFGPVVDGSYVPALPGQRLLNRSYDHKMNVIAARNSNEGTFFTSPSIQNDTAFKNLVVSLLPDAPAETIIYITDVLYPPVFDGTYPYLTQFERGVLITTEFTITCHSYELANAFSNEDSGNSWKYLFAVPPGYHGTNIAYTFFNGDTSTPSPLGGMTVNATIANVLQHVITNFAQNETPNGIDVPNFQPYGSGRVFDLNVTALGSMLEDPDNNPRCQYWQQAAWL